MGVLSDAYFGEPWPSGVCDFGEQVPTPIGRRCAWCDEAVVDGDRGTFVWARGEDETVRRPMHRECSLRTVMGSIGHLTGTCSCFKTGEEVFEDPPGLSRREAAQEVWDFVTSRGVA